MEEISEDMKMDILESVNKQYYDLEEINQDNWPYFIQIDNELQPLNYLDCMEVQRLKD